jgi:nucleolar protein 56
MTDKSRSTRRGVLAGCGTAATGFLAGCATLWNDDGEKNGDSPDVDTAAYDLSFSHSQTVRGDDPFDITITGLPADVPVDVVFTSEDAAGTTFEGRATIETGDGSVTLSEATVVSEPEETTDGVVPPDSNIPLPVALVQFAAPPSITFYDRPAESTARYRIEAGDETLGTTTVTRRFPTVSGGIDPENPPLVGSVYEPPESDTGPGVILLHGPEDDALEFTAATLAEHGFTAFALQYLGEGRLPSEIAEIPVEYVQIAGEWLLDHETVSTETVGLYGESRGGELALLAASAFDVFGPVVSVSGSGIVTEGTGGGKTPGNAAWSLDGEPLPYLSTELGAEGFIPTYERYDEDRKDEVAIPVEEIDDRVLLVSGAADTLWPSSDLQQIAADRLADAGTAAVDHLVYEEAGHSFTQPYQPISGFKQNGGTVSGGAVASHDYWPSVLETLETVT